MKSVNLPEHVKSARLIEAQHHLELANKQRDDYYSQCKKAAESFESSVSDGTPPCYMHYSFDFAQQLHYPLSSQVTYTSRQQENVGYLVWHVRPVHIVSQLSGQRRISAPHSCCTFAV